MAEYAGKAIQQIVAAENAEKERKAAHKARKGSVIQQINALQNGRHDRGKAETEATLNLLIKLLERTPEEDKAAFIGSGGGGEVRGIGKKQKKKEALEKAQDALSQAQELQLALDLCGLCL